ncbi:S41 family peptidase [Psychrobacter lutiphocae]|uniref:S41 family peptidase n=1 Tax=Psychrobacter lutiphocae TaxID=540500 RepID=UPI000374D568|nr:S41 family peptidase [Psychrobacter lutiphocae]
MSSKAFQYITICVSFWVGSSVFLGGAYAQINGQDAILTDKQAASVEAHSPHDRFSGVQVPMLNTAVRPVELTKTDLDIDSMPTDGLDGSSFDGIDFTSESHATNGFDDETPCTDSCDDIDAIATEDEFDESVYADNEVDPVTGVSISSDIELGIEHVPLNAISPETIETFVEVIDVIRHDYLHPVNDEVLFQHAITGMLEKLDSHAEYLTEESYERLRSFTDGEVGQVGIFARYDNTSGYWIVNEVLAQSSAKEMGVEAGDRLLRIKRAELTSDMTPQDITQLLSGVAGSQVSVTLLSKRGTRRNLNLQRNLAADNKLQVTVQQDIAVVRLPVFQNGTKDQLIDALRQTGVPITGVVLDVRNNPGGVLSSAIDLASLFIRDSNLIQVRNRTNRSQLLKSNGVPYLSDLPVVILQNRYSASAAEVLASSFKSNQRAKILGEQSFGKGTVQEVIPLKSGGALKLTVAEYRSTSGDPIDGIGVTPDIHFEHDGVDWQQRAVNYLLTQDRPLGIKFDDKFEGLSVIEDY